MTSIEQIVGMARSLMSGALGNEVSRLATSYTPGDTSIRLRHDKRIGDGSVMSVGLTTLIAAQSTTGAEVAVVAGYDGSPDISSPTDTLVHLRPRHTTFQVYQEVAATIAEVGSPKHGLHGIASETFPVDVTDGTYVLARPALKILRVRYLEPGSTDEWHNVAWAFQPGAPSGPTVVSNQAPGESTIQVQYAVPFTQPERLDDTLENLGIPDEYSRLLSVGAARNLSLSTESRRSQVFSQGDPRRAEEVPSTGNVVVYDRLVRQFRDLVADARAAIISQYPYRFQMESFSA
jgi:hypothetical protein